MKHYKYFIIALFVCICCISSQTINAYEMYDTTTYIEQDDNYYYEITIDDLGTLNSRATSTRKGSKTATCKDSSGRTLWSVTVNGTFTYDGSSSSCTAASVSTSVVNGNWKITNKSSSKSGNTAKATATAICYLNGNPINSATKTVTLSCDANGNLY